MANIVSLRQTGALTRNDPRRLRLFTTTVGKELRGAEIDEALEWCTLYGANPFTRDIYFFVFDADKPTRRVVPVLGIGLYRKIAARAGNYRPDEQAPRFGYDDKAKGPANPRGMLWCEVTVFQHSHGAWHPITSRLKWEERAPLKEEWAEDEKAGRRKPTGRVSLDAKKTNWHTMPETMLAKCTEADAIRKGWPNETAGSYVAEEMDAAHTIDLTATEIVAAEATKERMAKIGGPALLVDWMDGKPLDRVSVGQMGDRALAWITTNKEEPSTVLAWAERNRYVLQEYWALDAAGALAVKAAIEQTQEASA
jgi:phage recombination protein Bet